jgi:tetratricopeptide (TPR) repeat protein
MPETPLNQLDPGLQKQVEHARTALDRGNPDYAIELLGDVLRREPGCLVVRRFLRAAQVKRLAGSSRLKRAVQGARRYPGLLWAGWLRRRQPAKSMDLAEEVLGWNPIQPGALRVLADAALRLDLKETAIFTLEALMDARPADARPAVALSRVLLQLERPGEALKIAEAWSRRRPQDEVFRDLLKEALVTQSLHKGGWDSGSGSYRDKLRDEEEAVDLEKRSRSATPAETLQRVIREAREAIGRDPEALNHHVTLVRAYQDSGDYEQAIEWLGRARRLRAGASDPSLARRAVDLEVARLRANRVGDEAIRETRVAGFLKLVGEFPRESPFRFELAGLLLAAGRLDEAIRHYQEVQGVGTFRVRATAGLADCFFRKGMPDLALAQYETARDALPVMDELKKHVVYQLALCQEAAGRTAEAMTAFKSIYASDIDFRDVAARIGRTGGPG